MGEGLKIANDIWEAVQEAYPQIVEIEGAYFTVVAVVHVFSLPEHRELFERLKAYQSE